MENNYIYNVETSWPFPIIQYATNTFYVEVRKASGIAYILLELISRVDENNEKLSVTLKNLGVPSDIHYIFAGELANMISYEIVKMKANRDFGIDLLDMYYVSDFEVTDLGKKLFAEGTIPKGENSVKRLEIYYDVSVKDTLVKPEYKLFRMDNSTLDLSCTGTVLLEKEDIELFVAENMNKYGFKKGESITGYEHAQPEYLVYKIEDTVQIKIDQERMYICAKDKMRDSFIHANYSADILSKVIGAKTKYKFPEGLQSEINNYEYNRVFDIVGIFMPSQLMNTLSTKNQLSLSRGKEMKNSECVLDKEISSEVFQQCELEGYACYFEQGKLYVILPGRYAINVEGFQEKCEVNLIVVKKMKEEVAIKVLQMIFLKCFESIDPLKKSDVIRKLSEISGRKDYIEQFTQSLLKKQNSADDKAGILLALNDQFLSVKSWAEIVIHIAQHIFEELCTQVSIDNFGAKNALGQKLNKILKYNDIEYLEEISRNLKASETDEIVYEALEGLNYSTESILGVINIFKKYLNDALAGDSISARSKLGIQCALLGQTLSELRELSGIFNVAEDAASLDIKTERFIQVLASYNDSLKKLEKYKMYANEQYNELLLFKERFTDIKEVLSIEMEALKTPAKINKNYIDQMLKKSRYKEAICDLHVRLQYELNRLYKTQNEQSYDLLSNSDISIFLSAKEVNEMHLLRKCRNEFQHPTMKRTANYSEKKIKEWCEIVEKLGGMNSESRSKD